MQEFHDIPAADTNCTLSAMNCDSSSDSFFCKSRYLCVTSADSSVVSN